MGISNNIRIKYDHRHMLVWLMSLWGVRLCRLYSKPLTSSVKLGRDSCRKMPLLFQMQGLNLKTLYFVPLS